MAQNIKAQILTDADLAFLLSLISKYLILLFAKYLLKVIFRFAVTMPV